MTDIKGHPGQKIVIVGGGFGGVKAALALSGDERFAITLISERPDFYYFPTMYQTATGGSSEFSAIPLGEIFSDSPVRVVAGKATAIDHAAKTITLDDGRIIPYDRAILALGVVTNFFGIPGLAENTYGIKTIPDVQRLKRHLHAQLLAEGQPDTNYIVVGGGPTGIELAGSLGHYLRDSMKKHGIERRVPHVDLVEAQPHLMPRMSRHVSRKIERRLRQLGVKLYLNSRVEGASAEELTVSGKQLHSHTIIWTAGVATNPFFETNGFTMTARHKVAVDEFLRSSDNKDVFVLGDNADTPYSGMAQTALRDGEFVAHNLQKELDGHPKLAYRPKEPVYITPIGPRWAAVRWGKVNLFGILGWLMRHAADFHGFSDMQPLPEAVHQWSEVFEREDLCPVCGSDT